MINISIHIVVIVYSLSTVSHLRERNCTKNSTCITWLKSCSNATKLELLCPFQYRENRLHNIDKISEGYIAGNCWYRIILTKEKLHLLLHTHVCMWHRGRGDRVKQPGQTLRPPGFSQHPQCRQPSCQQQHLEFLVGVCATRLLNIFHITPHEICLWSVPTCPVILEKLLELPAPLLQKRWAIILLQAILTWWAESSEDVQPRELTAKFPPRLLWHLSPQHAPSDRQSVHANFHSWSYSSPPLPSLQTQPATVQAGRNHRALEHQSSIKAI